MPELPEVHTTATILNKLLKNLTVRDVWSNYHSVYHLGKRNIKDQVYLDEFRKNVRGKKILGVRRRAKNVLIDLSRNVTILIHMKMTGHLLYGKYEKNTPPSVKGWEKETWIPHEKENEALKDTFNRFIRLVFTLSNGKHLALSDMRKFAKVTYFQTDNIPGEIDQLGPEPLTSTFNLAAFRQRIFKKPNGKIKQVLMNQEIIAGIGNIYSDEILFQAGVHPISTVEKIPEPKITLMFRAMKEVLRKGIDFRGDSTSDYRTPSGERGQFQYHHHAYRQTGKSCTKRGCKGKILRLKVGGRSAHFCNTHQILYS
jgi:formamidopyrimidine-DNA glycosylase